ncbi:anti-sigma factor family protein [Curvibacter delicatus]|jgi:anti-sigma factor RsiW|uniref:anti-sigma factor family protein n=1 Tax=Curvibacter delicatus TaxID=80879 RepID=UPI00082E8AEF|nr:zf-HC2 domain-containing protein [Curvibacter delicatus]
MSSAEKCPRTEEISALVDDELAEPARVALDAHVAGCVICAPVLTEFRQLRTTFAALPDVTPNVDFAFLVDRRIAAAGLPTPQPKPQRWRWWQLAPATLGGALSLSLGVYLGGTLMLGSQVIAQPAALQMAAFAAIPPGALCPALQACNSMGR